MMSMEENTQSFIVRIWHEEGNESGWRGHVKHVPSGEKYHFQTFDEFSTILQRYIDRFVPKSKD